VPERSAADDSQPGAKAAAGRFRGLITDWGGVLTNPIRDTVNAWLRAEGILQDSYFAVMRLWMRQAYAIGQAAGPIHLLERGECSDEDFERLLAASLVRIDGQPASAAGLLTRMFAATVLDPTMPDLIRAVRRAGLRTALLSNSWGSVGFGYPRQMLSELFDAVVISAEVGMRKPEQRIFTLTVELLGLRPDECVFIDDVQANVEAAESVGLVGVHHEAASSTAARLAELLNIPLPGFAPNQEASQVSHD